MKEKDPIKDYVEQHREAFDMEDLPEDLWSSIEQELPEVKTPKMVPLRAVLQVAAVVALVVTAGLWFILQDGSEDLSAENNPAELVDPLDQYPELAEAEFYYQTRISEAEDALSEYTIDPEAFETLDLLEEEMNRLKADLGEQVDNERLIEAMVQLYQYKLKMLEQMLNQIKNLDHESEEDEVVVVSM